MNTPQAHLVDDDEAILDALAWLLKNTGHSLHHLLIGRSLPCRLESKHEWLRRTRHAHVRDERPRLL